MSIDEKVKEVECSHIAGRTTKWFSLEHCVEFYKVTCTLTIWLNSPTPNDLLKWNESLCSHKYLYTMFIAVHHQVSASM